MTRVWVSQDPWSDSGYVFGVYSSEERAEAAHPGADHEAFEVNDEPPPRPLEEEIERFEFHCGCGTPYTVDVIGRKREHGSFITVRQEHCPCGAHLELVIAPDGSTRTITRNP